MLSWPWAEAGTPAAADIANAAIAPSMKLRTEYISPPGRFFGLLGNSLAKARWKSTAKNQRHRISKQARRRRGARRPPLPDLLRRGVLDLRGACDRGHGKGARLRQ